MKLYVTRHGETDWNKERRVLGASVDIELNQMGLEQAAALAKVCRGHSITKIIASPMKRAQQTAAAVATELALPVQTDVRLREQNYGIYEGANWLDEDFRAIKKNFACRFPEGESQLQTVSRIYTLLDELKETNCNDTILLVTHGGVCRVLHTYFADITNKEFFYFSTQNCELREYTL